MAETTIEIEAETLEEARTQVTSQIPQGLHVVSEQVLSDGKPRLVRAAADTIEGAFAMGKSQIPAGAAILGQKELSAPKRHVVTVQAFDESGVELEVRRQLLVATILKSLKLTVPGKKGFLGMGKTPNQYEAEVFQQAEVEITYREKARVRAKVAARDWAKEGTGFLEQGRFKEAMDCFDRAVDVDPQDVGAWFNKGYCLNQLKDLDAALACFDKVLQISPKVKKTEWMAWTMKGICLKGLGRTDDALKCYDTALGINAQDFMALYNKGCILMEQKHHEEALAYFKRTIALGSNPNYRDARFNAGRCLIALGRHEEAAQYLG